MTAFILFYHPERDTDFFLGVYESEDDLKGDIKILESIDKLVSSLHNKEVHPQHQHNEEIIHYSWRKVEIAPRKPKEE